MPRGRVARPLTEKYTINKDSGCWEWIKSTRGGYGLMYEDSKNIQAHVYFYEKYIGKVLPGYVVHHLCRNRKCVNPIHLEMRTQQDNIIYGNGVAAKRAAQTHCNKGHEFTPENTYLTKQNCRVCLTCNRERNRGR